MLRENELTKKYFPFLDGLRAVAILWVILHHLPIALPGWLNEIRIRGDLGVELFFSISSFLVFRSLHQCMLKNNEDKFEFLKRRLFRIFPPYFFTLGLIWIMALFDKGLSSKISSIKDIALSFPFFYYNYAITHTAGNVPGSLNIFWSLSFEEQFYMALFLLTYLMPRRISIFVMAGILISISLRLLKFFLHIPMMPVELQMQTHLRLDAILLGCFFYYYWVYLKKYFNFLALNSVLILITIFLHSFLNYRYQGLLYILISLSFTAFVFNMLKKDK
jgi:peptidoglycan/LPS O-acetylase OafA/YrhL